MLYVHTHGGYIFFHFFFCTHIAIAIKSPLGTGTPLRDAIEPSGADLFPNLGHWRPRAPVTNWGNCWEARINGYLTTADQVP